MENEQIIRKFYESFAQNNADEMVSCYHDEIEFSDPAFGLLKCDRGEKYVANADRTRKRRYKNQFFKVAANEKTGSADWTAEYLFSKTGRKVFNEIHAEFEFKDGKIFRHTDTFDIWKWSKQALGLPGL